MNVFGTFAVTGPQGSGKSLICAYIARDYLLRGRSVLSNLNFHLDKLLPYWSKQTYIRLPDYPSVDELWSLGNATESADESEFSALIIDEIAVIANAREWNKKDRGALISFLRQCRKHGYNTYYISQDVESIDSQIRKSLIEHVVYCIRTDRIKIPFIGSLFGLFGIKLKFPLFHIAKVRLGLAKTDLKVDTWKVRGKDLYSCYDTKQKFREEGHELTHEIKFRITPTPIGLLPVECPYTRTCTVTGFYSHLSAWHLVGRYITKKQKTIMFIKRVFPYFLILGSLIYLASFTAHLFTYIDKKTVKPSAEQTEQIKLQLPPDTRYLTNIKGVINNGYYFTIKLTDGTLHNTAEHKTIEGVHVYRIGDNWHALPKH